MGAPRYQATGRPLSRSKGPDLWPVAITAALLVGVGRAEPVTGFVVDQPCQKAWRFGVGRGAESRCPLLEGADIFRFRLSLLRRFWVIELVG